MAKKLPEQHDVCVCPLCEEEIAEASFPFCQACKVAIFRCSSCRKPIAKENKVCPHCGAKISQIPRRE